jgi:dTDP-4-amino-4,6-dideoxygalactose transaminase
MTFVATVEAVTQAGATPVFVDVRDDDFGLDPDCAEAALTPRTKALMPVHLYGQLADMQRLSEIARMHDLLLFEDACQAHGAQRDGRRAGTEGIAGAFSFYPGKNLGAMGDAGALVTADEGLASRVRALREHGQTRKYHHDYDGYTSRLDTIQAIVLSHKLPHLDRWNAERRAAARWYAEALDGIGDLVLPTIVAGSEPVWHLYVVRTNDPVRLADDLRARGIATGRHYPEPVHASPAFSRFVPDGTSFPVAEAVGRECLSLPIFPGMTAAQVEAVADAVRASFAARG